MPLIIGRRSPFPYRFTYLRIFQQRMNKKRLNPRTFPTWGALFVFGRIACFKPRICWLMLPWITSTKSSIPAPGKPVDPEEATDPLVNVGKNSPNWPGLIFIYWRWGAGISFFQPRNCFPPQTDFLTSRRLQKLLQNFLLCWKASESLKKLTSHSSKNHAFVLASQVEIDAVSGVRKCWGLNRFIDQFDRGLLSFVRWKARLINLKLLCPISYHIDKRSPSRSEEELTGRDAYWNN